MKNFKILSYSRRQDAPSSAKHMQHLLDGFKQGFIEKVGSTQVIPTKNVKFIVFWSKYPLALEQVADQIPVQYYLLYTITGHGKIHEPNVPDVQKQIALFIKLSEKLGKNRVIWRFDPVIIDKNLPVNKVIEQFKFIGEQIHPYTNKVVFSFVDTSYLSGNKAQNGYKYQKISQTEQNDFLTQMLKITSGWNLPVYSCAEGLSFPQVLKNKCIDNDLISQITGESVPYEKDKAQTREHCQCHKSTDVGSYASNCAFQCGYCYGNYFRSMDANRKNQQRAKLNFLNSL
jgi:Domain of unknown function (DUF1848)